MMALSTGAAFLPGCDKADTIQRYQVAKTSDAPSTPDVAMAGAQPPAPNLPGAGDMPAPDGTAPGANAGGMASQAPASIQWTVPPTWKQLPGKEMRYASFIVSPADPKLELSVVPLGGTGGSLLSNINRWEGQIGLPSSTDDDLKNLVTRVDVAGTPVDLFDRTGAPPADHSTPERIIAAIASHGDRTWFFKLSGPADEIQSQIANFHDFIQSIRFDAPPAADAGVTPPLAAPGAGAASTAPPADAGAPLPITFSVPSGWQQEQSGANAFRVVAFTVASGADAGEAVVTCVAAGSGTMIDNVNRWRGQVGLDPLTNMDQDKTQKLAVGNREAVLWDFDNTAGGHRMLVAMITYGQKWWFFKLVGSPSLVAAEKAAFNQFVTSVQFRGPAGE
jgi:hypothetical protein